MNEVEQVLVILAEAVRPSLADLIFCLVGDDGKLPAG